MVKNVFCEVTVILTYDRSNLFIFGCLSLPSSSVERAKRGMVSRLCVLLITRGLVLLSDWEELEEARGRRLQADKDQLDK